MSLRGTVVGDSKRLDALQLPYPGLFVMNSSWFRNSEDKIIILKLLVDTHYCIAPTDIDHQPKVLCPGTCDLQVIHLWNCFKPFPILHPAFAGLTRFRINTSRFPTLVSPDL
jgi:hypothetical protein